MREVLTAIVPCRFGSERIPEKNTRPFGPGGESLLEIKLRQLERVGAIDSILVSTNDPKVVSITERMGIERVEVDLRPEELCVSETPIQSLTRHFGLILPGQNFLWTHVTSPFMGSSQMEKAIETFFKLDNQRYDSLIATEPIRDFCVYEGKPLNFGISESFWPRTQDLEPIFRVTSSVYMGAIKLLTEGNRWGRSPFLWETSGLSTLDIDWPHDFEVASSLAESNASALQ